MGRISAGQTVESDRPVEELRARISSLETNIAELINLVVAVEDSPLPSTSMAGMGAPETLAMVARSEG